MERRTLDVIHRGIDAAELPGIPQVLIPKAAEKLFLNKNESADLGPKFIQSLAKRFAKPLPEDMKWIAAAGFHFGYAAIWGAIYSMVQERWKMRPWVGGLGLAAFLHVITFAR